MKLQDAVDKSWEALMKMEMTPTSANIEALTHACDVAEQAAVEMGTSCSTPLGLRGSINRTPTVQPSMKVFIVA